MDQQILIQFLKKYRNRVIAINRFFRHIKNNYSRFEKTFTKEGNFFARGLSIFHISEQHYISYVESKSISEISKDLLG